MTLNLRDFPEDYLRTHGIEPQHPDVFIRHVLDVDHAVALTAVKTHRESLHKPAFSADDYIDMLARQGLGETASFLRRSNRLI